MKKRGYEVAENAVVKGRSGVKHTIDILAIRDDGIISYNIAIGVKVASDKIALEEIFDFADKAYNSGIHDKVLIVFPDLVKEAESFATLQRIKVLEVRDLETILSQALSEPVQETERKPFEFESKLQLIQYLEKQGYRCQK